MKAARSSSATISSLPSWVSTMPQGLPPMVSVRITDASPPARRMTAIRPVMLVSRLPGAAFLIPPGSGGALGGKRNEDVATSPSRRNCLEWVAGHGQMRDWAGGWLIRQLTGGDC